MNTRLHKFPYDQHSSRIAAGLALALLALIPAANAQNYYTNPLGSASIGITNTTAGWSSTPVSGSSSALVLTNAALAGNVSITNATLFSLNSLDISGVYGAGTLTVGTVGILDFQANNGTNPSIIFTTNNNYGTNIISSPIKIDATGGLTLASAGNNASNVETISGPITAGAITQGLTKTGAGAITLSGANTYGGQTVIDNGTLSVSSIGTNTGSSSLGTNASIQLGSSANAATLSWTGSSETAGKNFIIGNTTAATDIIQNYGSGALILNGNISQSGSVSNNTVNILAKGSSITVNGTISGATLGVTYNGYFTNSGQTVNLTNNVANNSYGGTTTLAGGTVILGTTTTIGNPGANSVFGTNGTIVMSGSNSAAQLTYNNANGETTTKNFLTGSATNLFYNTVSTAQIYMNVAASLRLNGNFDATTTNYQAFNFDAKSSASSYIYINGAIGNNSVANNNLAAAYNFYTGAAFTGGTVYVNNASNGYAGGTLAWAGGVSYASGNSLGTGPITLGGYYPGKSSYSVTLTAQTNVTVTNNIILGPGTVSAAGSGNALNTTNWNYTNTVAGTTNTFGNTATYSGTITQGTTNAWITTPTNAFSGIRNNTTGSTAFLNNTNNTFTGGVWIQNGNIEVLNLGNSNDANSSVGTGTVTFYGSGAATVGSLIYAGAGESSTRQINITGLSAPGFENLGTGGLVLNNVSFANTANSTMSLYGPGNINIAANITNSSPTVTNSVTVGSTYQTWNTNTLTGVTNTSTGTFTLSGSNSYSGATTVAGGTLNINGSLTNSSALTVNSGGTLGGTGTINVNTVVNGTLAPGVNGIGTLTVGGLASLSLTNTSSITSITIASPTSFGQLAYSSLGTFTIGGTLNFNLYTISAPVVFTNTVLDAATYGNSISGDFSSVYVGTNALSIIGTDGGGQSIWGGSNNNIAYTFDDGTGQITVTSSVPEPSTNALLLVASLGTLIVVVRRRRAASR